MKKLIAITALAAAVSTASTANAQDVLTGDTRLACEAILCLSSSVNPSECSPSLSRYFGIVKRTMSKTIRARLNFLNLCPVADQTPEMRSLVSAISNGAGRCDAASLNRMRGWGVDGEQGYISNQLPAYCATLTGHDYTDFSDAPRYVGKPERGGYWVEASDYERALAEYNERIAREDEERRRAMFMP